MSSILIKKYYDWFDKEITEGADVDKLIEILYLGISYYFQEIKNMNIVDDTYIISESISYIYKIAEGKSLKFRYFLNMVNRLKCNLYKNNKTIKFKQLNSEQNFI